MTMEDRILRRQEIACGETCADYCEKLEEVCNERDKLQEKYDKLVKAIKSRQISIGFSIDDKCREILKEILEKEMK